MSKHFQDTIGKISKIANRIIKEEPDYAPLKHLNILFVWKEGKPSTDEDSRPIVACATVLPKKIRDLFGFDVSVEVNEDIWTRLTSDWKYRVCWHELRHFSVEMDEETHQPIRDKDGRILVHTKSHNIVVKTFKEEIEKFGVEVEEMDLFRYLKSVLKRVKKGELKKYAAPGILKPEENVEEENQSVEEED